MFQGKFEMNQTQARGDMNEGGIVSFLLSQILGDDGPLPTSEGIGAPLYMVLLPPSQNHNKRRQTCLFSYVGKMLPRQRNYNIALIAAKFSQDVNQVAELE